MKWRHKKFTFMVIPDANSSVIRFQLSALILISGIAVIIALIAGCIAAFLIYRGSSGQIGQLKHQLSSASVDYERIIDNKSKHIDELQTNLIDLSEQAKTISTHMNDLKSLESQLKEMVGIDAGDSRAKAAHTQEEDSYSGQFSMDGGTGGEDRPVTEEEMKLLLDQTRDEFLNLGEELETMKPELEFTKSQVAKQQKLIAVTPTIWPTDSRKITSTFGIRKDPFKRRATYHAGLDIGANIGEPIYAAANGTVIEAGRSPSHGNNVLISHSNGLQTHYSHMSKIITTVGAKVSKGDIIGEIGSTGRSTGPHLHYEVILNGEHVDPLPYLKASRRSP
ncbi:M23 family metallopeptidase [Cohnella abietis]|uniref:M23ase beta-sheet core domain-containing protein n=1 Tax=Cohnella abietis TaxID=2507935 RepID=A0A3T1DBK7_9BACL|nr:M23 family metallopeptidase [Cohnella abietis]BBI35345.1 hypothetical protein KCTCHS21_47440 [Cohnella abietis]